MKKSVWNPAPALEAMKSQKWLIDGILPADSHVLLFGQPATFKSFIVMDWAAAIASGQPWQGRETKKAIVVYLAAEGGNAVHLRRAGAEQARSLTGQDVPLAVVQHRPRLDEPAGADALARIVDHCAFGRLDPKLPTPYDHVSDDESLAIEAKYAKPDDDDDDGFPSDHDAVEREVYALANTRATAAEKASWAAVDATEGVSAYAGHELDRACREIKDVVLIVDTFAQVCSDDTKTVVSQYGRALRDVQGLCHKAGMTLTTVTVDHTGKNGDDYLGTVAKLGNSDVAIRVNRPGNAMSTKLTCEKMKDAPEFDSVSLDLAKVEIVGHVDGYGRPLQTLTVTDGERTARLRRLTGSDGDSVAGKVLALIDAAGSLHMDDLKTKFTALPDQASKKPETVKRSFRRAIDGLIDDDVITLDNDIVSMATS